MGKLRFIALCIGFFIAETAQSGDASVASDGNVQITEIHIQRSFVAGSPNGSDQQQTRVRLWLATDEGEPPQYCLLRLLELGEIEDGSGKILTSKARMQAMRALNEQVMINCVVSIYPKYGPELELVLDAPARAATMLRSLHGKAEITPATEATVEFSDLPALCGRQLRDPKLDELPIKLTMVYESGQTTLGIEVTKNAARLLGWQLVNGERLLRPVAESCSTVEQGVMFRKSYLGDQRKNARLVLGVLEQQQPRIVEFNFKNVPLP